MEFFVISMTLLAFYIAVIVFSYFGKRADEKKRRIDYISGESLNPENNDPQESFFQVFFKKLLKIITKIFSNIQSKKVTSTNSAKSKLMERQLRLAGVFISSQEFNSAKMIAMLASTALFSILTLFVSSDITTKMMIVLVGFVVGFTGPTLYLRSRVKSHQQKIRDQLPDTMDLLSVCIEAGLSFDMSLLKVSERMKGPFIDELMIVHREIQMGRSRRDALQNLAASTDIPELKTFASALVQAEQLGIPIINVMRVQSTQLRVTRKQIAQEKGMKAPIKMLIPMIAFIFPVLFIILLGPTVINIMNNFMK